MTSGGNSEHKPDFGSAFVFLVIMVLCLLLDLWPVALLSLGMAILATHEAVKESREE